MGKRNTIHCRSRSCANCFGNSHASVTPSGCLEPQSQLATHVRRRGPTPRNDAGRRFFADETCNHHAAACSSLPGRCLRARRTRPPPQQRPLGVTEACLFTKQLVQDRLLQWISLFLPSVRTHSTKPARFRIPQVWLNRAFVIVRANCQLWSIMARGTYPNLACVRSHQACR